MAGWAPERPKSGQTPPRGTQHCARWRGCSQADLLVLTDKRSRTSVCYPAFLGALTRHLCAVEVSCTHSGLFHLPLDTQSMLYTLR